MESAGYHHGRVIRKYREKSGMSQRELAEKWPKANGDVGVGINYVQAIEYGKSFVVDQSTLRRLCHLLKIPLWEVGLSDYNPFNPAELPVSKRLIDETLDVAEHWIARFEHLYRSEPLPVAAADGRRLHDLFQYILREQPPTLQNEGRFLKLYSQVQNLDGIILLGYGRYEEALATFRAMYETADQLDDPAMLAHALLTIGTELERVGALQEAVEHLERARDLSFDSSKDVAAYVHAYLARCYSAVHDARHFERAIDRALNLAPATYGSGTDFVYHPKSGILAEKSYGYLLIDEPQKTLDMRSEFEEQIEKDNNRRLAAWAPLDWARAHKQLGDIEGSVKEGKEFFRRARELQAPHIISRVRSFAEELKEEYGDTSVVKDFCEEVCEEC